MDHKRAQLERLTFFSDAVFAIAMTLLVIEVKVPHLHGGGDAELGRALLMLIPQYIGFVVSFVVLARFWVVHYRVMGMLRGLDMRLVWTNLLFLLAVAFMPFPTAVLSEYVQLRVGIGFYTAWLVVLGIANLALIRAGLRDRRLVEEAVDESERLTMPRAGWTSIILGGIAFAAGMVVPIAAPFALALGAPIVGRLVRGRAT